MDSSPKDVVPASPVLSATTAEPEITIVPTENVALTPDRVAVALDAKEESEFSLKVKKPKLILLFH